MEQTLLRNLPSQKQGLASILASKPIEVNASSEVDVEMLRRTRVFYFNKCAMLLSLNNMLNTSKSDRK